MTDSPASNTNRVVANIATSQPRPEVVGVLRIVGLKCDDRGSRSESDQTSCHDITIEFCCKEVLSSDCIDDTINYVPILKFLNSHHQALPVETLQIICMAISPRARRVRIRSQADPPTLHKSPVVLAAEMQPVFSTPLSVFSMFGLCEEERLRKQPMNLQLTLPHNHPFFSDVDGKYSERLGELQNVVFHAANNAHSLTIERLCAIVAQNVVQEFHFHTFGVVLQKPEIGRLTNTDMQYASFELVHGSSFDPIPLVTPPSEEGREKRQPQHHSCSMHERAEQLRTLHRFSTEYSVLSQWVLESLMPVLSPSLLPDPAETPEQGFRILDIGAGFGTGGSSLIPCLRTQHEVEVDYVAFEPNPHMTSALKDSLMHEGARRVDVVTDLFTAQTAKPHFGSANLIWMCHSLYGTSKEDVIALLLCAAKCLKSSVMGGGWLVVIQRAEWLFPFVGDILTHFTLLEVSVRDAVVDLQQATEEERARAVGCMTGGCSCPDKNSDRGAACSNNSQQQVHDARMMMLLLEPKPVQFTPVLSEWVVPHAAATQPTASKNNTPPPVKQKLKNKDAAGSHPLLVVEPTTRASLCALMAECQAMGRQVTVVGGGHSDRCQLDNCVTVSLRHFRSVSMIEEENGAAAVVVPRRVRVEGGATTEDICHVLDPLGLMVPLGSRPSVGAGLILHGGVGHYTFLHGLSCDFIDSAEVLRPDGTVEVIDNSTMQGKAFALLRGCGSILGVVLSLTMRCVSFCPLRCRITADLPLHGAVGGAQRTTENDETSTAPTLDEALVRYFASSDPSGASVEDLYLTPDNRLLRQSFERRWDLYSKNHVSAVGNDKAGVSDVVASQSAKILSKYSDVFDAELHMMFPKTMRDFKRSIALRTQTHHHSRGDLADIAKRLAIAFQGRPHPQCYLHVLDCGDTHSSSSTSGPSSCIHYRNWRHVVVVTGRWNEDPSDSDDHANAVRQWVYRTIHSLLPFGYVLPTDVGPRFPKDLELLPHCFYGDVASGMLGQIAQAKNRVDPNSTILSSFPIAQLMDRYTLQCAALDRGHAARCVIVAVCGKRYCGKDFVAHAMASLLEEDTRASDGAATAMMHRAIRSKVVSVSDRFKQWGAKRHGLDVTRLREDRSYKEAHRALLHASLKDYSKLRQREEFVSLYNEEVKAGTELLIVTGMREADVRTTIQLTGAVGFCTLVTATASARTERGWIVSDADFEKSERQQDFLEDWDMVLDNSDKGSERLNRRISLEVLPLLRAAIVPVFPLPLPLPLIKECCERNSTKKETHDIHSFMSHSGIKAALRSYNGPQPTQRQKETQLVDVYHLSRYPSLFSYTIQWILTQCRMAFEADAIVTVESGGVMFAAPVAAALNIPLIVIRKVSSEHSAKEPEPFVTRRHAGSNASRRPTFLQLRTDPRLASHCKNPVLVDDTVSSGVTLQTVVQLLLSEGSAASLTLRGAVFVMGFAAAMESLRKSESGPTTAATHIPEMKVMLQFSGH